MIDAHLSGVLLSHPAGALDAPPKNDRRKRRKLPETSYRPENKRLFWADRADRKPAETGGNLLSIKHAAPAGYDLPAAPDHVFGVVLP
jgi:hypothetical protein